ncbi:hypothetical protein PMC2000_31075 [Burkholderia pseudomallei]|nr:hypothetical protein BHT10_23145 [Burkholderia pseudomallei]MUU86957.1 hypothetical protein [Burkholderia pseudomallei]QGS82831.1 hypothetical protein PMC2000_31075 [Burkholderia pseudomallei]QGS96013.1 hypothetical protein R15_31095 [Burkholderia pseudomallei]QGT08431.1 hypothetical protein D286_30485 [Burkholderia pseudomallei]
MNWRNAWNGRQQAASADAYRTPRPPRTRRPESAKHDGARRSIETGRGESADECRGRHAGGDGEIRVRCFVTLNDYADRSRGRAVGQFPLRAAETIDMQAEPARNATGER